MQWPGAKTLAYCSDSGDPTLLDEFFPSDIPRIEQQGRTLGQRLYHAANPLLGTPEKETVALIGCDCPDINISAISTLSAALATNDASFGPTDDGGYWCIALANRQAAHICLAADLPWSQENLLSETQQRLSTAKLSYGLGPRLNDIDTIEDLEAAEKNGFIVTTANIKK